MFQGLGNMQVTQDVVITVTVSSTTTAPCTPNSPPWVHTSKLHPVTDPPGELLGTRTRTGVFREQRTTLTGDDQAPAW